MTQKYFECGCCGAFHRTDYYGDCRNDAERFSEMPEDGEEVEQPETIMDLIMKLKGARNDRNIL